MATVTLEIDIDTKRSIASIKNFADRSSKALKRIDKNTDKVNLAFASFVGNLKAKAVANALNLVRRSVVGLTSDFFDFSRGVAEINSILPGTARLTDENRRQLIRFATAFGGKPANQAKAFYQIVSAGITDTADAIDLLSIANKAAVAGVTDIQTSIDGLTSGLATFASTGLDATDISDILFASVREGKTTFGELSANLGKVAPLARAANVSFSALGGTLAFVTKVGLSTDAAATGLRALFLSLLKPTDDATAAARNLGIELSSAAVEEKGFATVLKEIIETTGGSAEALAKLFPNIRALTVATAIAKGDFADFERILKETANSAGATSKAFAIIEESAAFQFDALIRDLTNLPQLFLSASDPEFANLFRVIRKSLVELAAPIAQTVGLMAALGLAVTDMLDALSARQIENSFKLIGQNFDELIDDLSQSNSIFLVGFSAIAEDIKKEAGQTSESIKAARADLEKDIDTSKFETFNKILESIGVTAAKLALAAEAGLEDTSEAAKKASKDYEDLKNKILGATKSQIDFNTKVAEFAGTLGSEVFLANRLAKDLELLNEANALKLLTEEEFQQSKEELELKFAEATVLRRFNTESKLIAISGKSLNDQAKARDKFLKDQLKREDLSATQRAVIQSKITKNELANQKLRVANQKSTLSTIATLSDSNNSVLAAIGKAAALTQIAIEGPIAVTKALAAFPPPFNFAAATAVGIAVAAQAAKVVGINLQGGLTEVPRGFPNDSFAANLTTGERVLNVPQNRDFTEFIKSPGSSGLSEQLLEKINTRLVEVTEVLVEMTDKLDNLENEFSITIGNKEIIREVREGLRSGRTLDVG